MKKDQKAKKEDITLTIEYKKPSLFWRIILGVFIFFLLSTLIFSLIAYRQVKKYQNLFLQGANLSQESFSKTFESVANDFAYFSENPDQVIKEKTLLILGTDQLEGRTGNALLTDTVLLIQLDLHNNQITSLALPRDLYHPDYKTKINALLYYGVSQNPDYPLGFPTQAIADLTGINIDHTLLIDIASLENLIDLVGGVKINIEESFIDDKFPRKGVAVAIETDPEILYETVVFNQGQEIMNGDRALKYMRSRNSQDDQGTDLARSQRQQVVLQAFLAQILNPDFLLKEPEKVGELYRFYLDNFDQSLSVTELAKTLISWLIIHQNNPEIKAPEFISKRITVYPEDEQGLIYNPPIWQTQDQWLYEIRDLADFQASLQEFFVKNELNY